MQDVPFGTLQYKIYKLILYIIQIAVNMFNNQGLCLRVAAVIATQYFQVDIDK